MVPAFLEGRDYPNLGMCGGRLARILILLQTPFVHLVVKQIRGRRQLIKVWAVTQSYLWAHSLSIRDFLIKQIVSRGGQLTKIMSFSGQLTKITSFSGHCGPFLTFQALG